MAKINFEDEDLKLRYRHTTSHIMAQAIKHIWPDAKLAIGPAIDNGFYYDIDMEHKLSDQDLMGSYDYPEGDEEDNQGQLPAGAF